MNQNFIDLFFIELDKKLREKAAIILTGAAAGALFGNIRPTRDIDFEIQLASRESEEKVAKAIERTCSQLGIAAQYSENISRWSQIEYLDYRKTAEPYKVLGYLDIKVMAPAYWTIGKMGRYLAIDIQDMIEVIKKRKLDPMELVALWERALRSSELSLACTDFRNHVLDFIRHNGKTAWGRKIDAEELIRHFKSAVHMRDKA